MKIERKLAALFLAFIAAVPLTSMMTQAARADGRPAISAANSNSQRHFLSEAPNISRASGVSVAGLGDVNGDGIDDVAVGNPYGWNVGVPEGVFVYFGGIGGIHSSPDWYASGHYGHFGFSVAGAGDLDKDGLKDLIVGAPFSGSAGEAFLFLGKDIKNGNTVPFKILAGTHLSAFGWSVAGVGDLDKDGFDDVAVGAPSYWTIRDTRNFGKVTAFKGNSDPDQIVQLWEHVDDDLGARFGYAVAGLGDTDADGFPDVGVGSPYGFGYNENAGKILVLCGNGRTVHRFVPGGRSGDQFGWSIAPVGDINQDGYADTLVGSPGANDGTGAVYYLLGGPNGPETPLPVKTPIPQAGGRSFFGSALSRAFDIDGDGREEWVITSPQTEPLAGKFSLYEDLRSVETPKSYAFDANTTESRGHRFGQSIAFAGDVNGDGYGDVIAGAPWRDNGESGALVFYGGPNGFGQPVFLPGPRIVAIPSVINPDRGESAHIRWVPSKGAVAAVDIYNMMGDRVATPARNLDCVVGVEQNVPWDGRDSEGRSVGSGIYVGVVESGGGVQKIKIAVVR